jgi:hypothetical protein
MKRMSSSVFSIAISSLLISLALTGCSRATTDDACKQVTEFNASLTEKADKYWEEDNPKNGGSGDYSRSEALIVEADQLVIDNPTCFTKEEVSLSEGRLEVNAPEETASEEPSPTVTAPQAKTPKPKATAKASIFDQPAQK